MQHYSTAESLVHVLWRGLVGHVKNAVEHTSKPEHVDCFSLLMTSLKEITVSQCLEPSVTLVSARKQVTELLGILLILRLTR